MNAGVLNCRAGIIGYGVLSCAAGEAHVLNVCVAPEHQGHGHGRHVLRRLIDIARWHMADRVFLEVRPTNLGAIALYDSEGFQRDRPPTELLSGGERPRGRHRHGPRVAAAATVGAASAAMLHLRSIAAEAAPTVWF